jgi:hypothetical protein
VRTGRGDLEPRVGVAHLDLLAVDAEPPARHRRRDVDVGDRAIAASGTPGTMTWEYLFVTATRAPAATR